MNRATLKASLGALSLDDAVKELREQQQSQCKRLQSLETSVNRLVERQTVHTLYAAWLGKAFLRVSKHLGVVLPELPIKEEDL